MIRFIVSVCASAAFASGLLICGAQAATPSARLTITSATSCPNEAQIVNELAAIAPNLEAAGARVHVDVEGDADGAKESRLTIELRGGASSGGSADHVHREVPVGARCDERAQTAAVVIAAWHARIQSPGLSSPSVSLPMSSAAPVIAAAPAARVLELGGALAGGFVGDSVSPGGALDLSWLPAAREGFGVGAGAMIKGGAPATQNLAGGRVQWARPSLAAGLRARWDWHSFVSLTLRQELVAAVLIAEGSDFAAERGGAAFAPGVGAGARLARRWGQALLWTDLGGEWFFRSARASVTTAEGAWAHLTVPHWQGALMVGLSVVIP